MSEEQHRLLLATSSIAGHQVTLTRIRTQHLDVVFGKSGGFQAFGHGLSSDGGISRGVGRIDFNQLFINFSGELDIGFILCGEEQYAGKQTQHHGSAFPPKSTSSGSSSTSVAAS